MIYITADIHGRYSIWQKITQRLTPEDILIIAGDLFGTRYPEWSLPDYQPENIRAELAGDLLAKLKKSAPTFFEQIVVELLVKMGYGGSRADAGKAIGKSGDGGIDGIIKQDKLGLDVIYIQAKRWDSNAVGSPDVMQFAGALQAQKAIHY